MLEIPDYTIHKEFRITLKYDYNIQVLHEAVEKRMNMALSNIYRKKWTMILRTTRKEKDLKILNEKCRELLKEIIKKL